MQLSLQEAFGAVTNETLIADSYALVSNKAGSSCLIEEGLNGYTFPPMGVDELSECMIEATKFALGYEDNGIKKSQMIVPYESYKRKLMGC